MDTKKKIIDVSLELFSQKGFTAISVRDICKIVGVKESAIYYFFKNKKEILDTLLEEFLAINKNYTDSLYSNTSQVNRITQEDFLNVIDHYLEDYLMNPFVNSFIKILYIEQSNNTELRKLFNKVLFDEPIQFQSMIFDILINLGYLKKVDSQYLAVSFYAPILYYYQKYLIALDMTEDTKSTLRNEIKSHTDFFLKQYSEVHYE